MRNKDLRNWARGGKRNRDTRVEEKYEKKKKKLECEKVQKYAAKDINNRFLAISCGRLAAEWNQLDQRLSSHRRVYSRRLVS